MTDSDLPVSTKPKGIDIADLIHYQSKGLSHSEIGALVGCSAANVTQRLRDLELDTQENYATYKDKVFEHIQRNAVKNITDADLKRLNPLQRITAAAILQDKIMVMRGQANNITENRNITIDLTKAYEAMRSSSSVPIEDTTPDAQVIDIPICPGSK